MAAPVWGLRPMRACALPSRPADAGMTKTPFFFVSLIAVQPADPGSSTCLLVSSSSRPVARQSGLGQSSCHSVVLLLGALGPSMSGLPPRYAYRKEGSATDVALARNPCIHAVGVRRSLQCAWAGQSQPKKPFSTNFLGNNAYFAYFCPISPGFRGSASWDGTVGLFSGGANPRYSGERTFFLGARDAR